MAAAIEKELGIKPKLIKGKSGIFDVRADSTMVFSKHEVGRFPEEEEVLAGLRAL